MGLVEKKNPKERVCSTPPDGSRWRVILAVLAVDVATGVLLLEGGNKKNGHVMAMCCDTSRCGRPNNTVEVPTS